MTLDGYHLILTTENGVNPSSTICLEPAVLSALFDYLGVRVERKVTEDKKDWDDEQIKQDLEEY